MSKDNSIYNLNALVPAFISAHAKNNRKAITKDDAEKCGVDLAYFDMYKNKVEVLYKAVSAYVVAKNNPANITDKDSKKSITTLRNKIYPLWKDLMTMAEPEKHKRLLAQITDWNYDVDSLVGYCETFIATDKGTAQSTSTLTKFRKSVESLLGCRLAGNNVLDGEDRDIVILVKGALRTIERSEKSIPELEKKITAYENTIKLSSGNEEIKKILTPVIEQFKETLTKMKSSLTEAQKVVAEKKNVYDAVMNGRRYAEDGLATMETEVVMD